MSKANYVVGLATKNFARYYGLLSRSALHFWYDEQSVCLCFDILSGANITLPFRCQINLVSTPISIIQAFLKDAQSQVHPLDFQNFKFLEPGDPGWDEFDDDEKEEDIPLITVNVYVMILPRSDIANFFKKIISS